MQLLGQETYAVGAEPIELSLRDPLWRSLVDADASALPFHEPAWGELLADCYGFRAFALGLLGDDGRLAAGLPLIETARRLARRRRWTSLPFTDYCQPLVRSASAGELLAAVDVARREQGVSRVELRADVGAGDVHAAGFRHVLTLEPDPLAVRRRFKKKQVQQRLTKAERDGRIEIRRAESVDDVAKVYYGLHASTRRRLGVPVQPQRFFRLLWERMLEPGHGWAVLAYAGRESVAGAVFLASASTVVYKFGASERRWQKLLPNNLLLWDAIRESCERGFSQFDFGRTDPWNEGLRSFKLGWGTDELELRYTRFGEAWAEEAGSAPGAAARLAGGVLQRAPVAVSRLTGELLYRYAA